MTYPAGTVTFGAPAFRTLADAQAWADAVYGWALDAQKRMNAMLAATRGSTVPAVADLSLALITDPAPAPPSVDALRDDLVANTIPSIEARLSLVQTAVNEILVPLRTNFIVET